MRKAVALLSGGMDSAVLAYKLQSEEYGLHLLSFNYGQKHSKEIEAARAIVDDLNTRSAVVVRHDVIMLSHLAQTGQRGVWQFMPLGDLLSGSSLTDPTVEVPDGHYAEESMKATVVPNRNAIMLSIAYGVAIADGAELVAFAAHSGDHAIYPDCRPQFVKTLSDTLRVGNIWADPRPYITGPFLNIDKTGIAQAGHELDVPFDLTWSCYKGGKIHCGRCGTCVERKEAFQLAGIDDPTAYTDYAFMGDTPDA